MVTSIRKFFRNLGPGLITGAADDDPSGISTYSVAGAATGYSMLWLTLISTPMMAVIQGMCARISMVNGEGIAALMRKRLPFWLAYGLAGLVIVANTFNLGADIGGMADAAHLVVRIPIDALVFFFGIALIAAQMWLPYAAIAKFFKWLTLALFAYIITAFIVRPPWLHVLEQFAVPRIHFDSSWLSTMVGVLGTTITPYLFYWQSSLMVEEEKEAGKATIATRRGTDEPSVSNMHADVNAGMIYSNLVAFFIIVTTAATLGAHGRANIATAQQAAEALRPLAGPFAELLFALGMVGTGILAVPVLATSSAYVAAQTFRFSRGIERTGDPRPALLLDHCGRCADWNRHESAPRRCDQSALLVGRAQRHRSSAADRGHRLARLRPAHHGKMEKLGVGASLGLGNLRPNGRSDGRDVLLLHGSAWVSGKGATSPFNWRSARG